MELTHNLVIDIGNTRAKAAIFIHNKLIERLEFANNDFGVVDKLIDTYQPTKSIVCNVFIESDELTHLLKTKTQYTQLTSDLPVPFHNLYSTPLTLGMDRVASVAGAISFFDNTTCLIIDLGTCVTYDIVTANRNYLGGSISPGLQMRLNALNHFTQKLPLFDYEPIHSFIGNSTQTSMLSGVYYGLLGEINEMITLYEQQFGNIQVLLCGGDAGEFDKHTKKSIFAAPDLVLYGLHKILQYNAK
jgi:type III pantothenate kinase